MALSLSDADFTNIKSYGTSNQPPTGSVEGICIYRRVLPGGSEYYAIYSYLNDQGMTYVNTTDPFQLPVLVTSAPNNSVEQLTTDGVLPMQHPSLLVVFFPLSIINNLMPSGGSVSFSDTTASLIVRGKLIQAPSLIANGNSATHVGRPCPPPWN